MKIKQMAGPGAVLFAALFTSSACSKKDAEDDAPGNARVVLEVSPAKDIEGTPVKLHRLRAWRSEPNNSAPGVLGVVDEYIVEVWFSLKGEDPGEKNTKLRYQSLGPFLADADGNLYDNTYQPGSVFYLDPTGAAVGSEGIQTYVVDQTDAFIRTKYPATAELSELSGTTADAKSARELLKAPDLDGAGWGNVARYDLQTNGLYTRTYYEENVNMNTKGKAGCVVKGVDDAGKYKDKQFLFRDVEVGSTLQDKDNRRDKTTPAGADAVGDDDALWIQWSEYASFVGLNIHTKKLRMIYGRLAPLYGGRELPGVDSSDKTPRRSGMEGLIRDCNTAAKGGQFMLLYLGGASAAAPNLVLSSALDYCSALGDATDPNAVDLRSFGTCFPSLSALVAAGTWDGSAHAAPVQSVSSTIKHVEQSAVIEVQL